MSCVDHIIFYLEFLFQNYCIFVYSSALFTKTKKCWLTAFSLAVISSVEFGVYFFDNVVLNMALFTAMTFVIL